MNIDQKEVEAVVRRIQTKLASLWAQFQAETFRPCYNDEDLMAILARTPAARDATLLHEALLLDKDRRAGQAIPLVVKHFDTRTAPRFFVDARAVLGGEPPSDIRLTDWIEAASAEMCDAIQVGLRIYGDRAARLRPGFPWGKAAATDSDDLLFTIRPHRLAFAPRLALAVCAGANSADEFRALLEDWMQFAQAQPSLPFYSNLVATQRLFAAAWAFAYLGAAPQSTACIACRFGLLKLIGQDIEYLVPRLGSSYANNHLLLDRLVNWFIAIYYPELRREPFDLGTLEAAWLKELDRQTYEDGGSFEHSVHYHGFATEMATAYLLIARANGRPVAAEILTRIGKMLRMQAELCGPDGDAPDIGDAADDPIFPLDSAVRGRAAAFREIYRALYDPLMAAVSYDHPAVERAFWLLGGHLAPRREHYQEFRFREYAQSGITVFLEDEESTRFTFRTGPVSGLDCMPGHMHADLLSVTLTYRGVPFLIDAGTFTYRFKLTDGQRGAESLRRYFAGPRAHNGFIVGDLDPIGPITGDFRSAAPAASVRHLARGAGSELAFVEAKMETATHYPQLSRGVVHMRGVGFITYNLVGGPVTDADVALAFQFAPECQVSRANGSHLAVRNGGLELAVAYSEGLGGAQLVSGREAPIGGWASSCYGKKVAAPQLLLDVSAKRSLSAVAILRQDDARALSIACDQTTADARCFRVESDDCCDYVLVNVGPAQAMVSGWDIAFHGRLVWIRTRRRGRPSIRWLDGLSCVAPAHGLNLHYDAVIPELSV